MLGISLTHSFSEKIPILHRVIERIYTLNEIIKHFISNQSNNKIDLIKFAIGQPPGQDVLQYQDSDRGSEAMETRTSCWWRVQASCVLWHAVYFSQPAMQQALLWRKVRTATPTNTNYQPKQWETAEQETQ